jgi:hypothetical protein
VTSHLLFNEAPPALLEKIEQVVRLIRSKGVGVYFVTQNPLDVPEKILGQLGNRVQHALRAYTPADQKAVRAAAQLTALGVAKQDANRLLEPFMFTTIVATASDRAWTWMLGLRDDPSADPKFAYPARLMHEAYRASDPQVLADGDWHLPYIDGQDIATVRRDYGYCETATLDGLDGGERSQVQITLARMSAARCARISYLRQHEPRDMRDELARASDLVRLRHWSPTEHQAQAAGRAANPPGNLGPGWYQHRHLIGDGF